MSRFNYVYRDQVIRETGIHKERKRFMKLSEMLKKGQGKDHSPTKINDKYDFN